MVSFISCGGASAHPLGVVPEIGPTAEQPGRIFLDDFFLIDFSFVFMLAGANADLRGQLSEAQAALCAKETKYDALVLERERLAKKLADQEESHKAALKKA